MRFVITGGGTGGGVFPALAVTEAVRAIQSDAEFLWIGSISGPERDLVERAGLRFEGVSGGPVVGVGARAAISAVRLIAGTMRAHRLLSKFRPDAILSTGGWPTIPATLAGWLRRAPILIVLPDIEPGSAIKVMARIAKRVAAPLPASESHFPPGKVVVTGYPLRGDLLKAAGHDSLGRASSVESLPHPRPRPGLRDASHRTQARPERGENQPQPFVDSENYRSLNAEGGRKIPHLLVMGGSKGARSINEALLAHLPDLLPNCTITHISGTLDADTVSQRAAHILAELLPQIAGRYHGVAFLHSEDMAHALASADLVVARAGASTLGEFPLFGLPAILVPYPYAWRYQKVNADALVDQGAALRLDDDQLAAMLGPTVLELLHDPARLGAMAAAMKSLAKPDASARIAHLLIELARA